LIVNITTKYRRLPETAIQRLLHIILSKKIPTITGGIIGGISNCAGCYAV